MPQHGRGLAHPLRQRREVAREIDQHIQRTGVGHRVEHIDTLLLEFPTRTREVREQQLPVVAIRFGQLRRRQRAERLLEMAQTLSFRLHRGRIPVGELPVILMPAEGHAFERPLREVSGEKLIGEMLVPRVGGLLSFRRDTAAEQQEKQERPGFHARGVCRWRVRPPISNQLARKFALPAVRSVISPA